jgi:hypothetical protein
MCRMSVTAVGGYITGVLERNKLLPAHVMDAAGVRPNYLWRLSSGEIKKPSAEIIAALVRAARGRMEIATQLLLDPTADYERGYARGQQSDPMEVFDRLDQDQLDAVARVAQQMLREK